MYTNYTKNGRRLPFFVSILCFPRYVPSEPLPGKTVLPSFVIYNQFQIYKLNTVKGRSYVGASNSYEKFGLRPTSRTILTNGLSYPFFRLPLWLNSAYRFAYDSPNSLWINREVHQINVAEHSNIEFCARLSSPVSPRVPEARQLTGRRRIAYVWLTLVHGICSNMMRSNRVQCEWHSRKCIDNKIILTITVEPTLYTSSSLLNSCNMIYIYNLMNTHKPSTCWPI